MSTHLFMCIEENTENKYPRFLNNVGARFQEVQLIAKITYATQQLAYKSTTNVLDAYSENFMKNFT